MLPKGVRKLRPPIWALALSATLLVQVISSVAAASLPLLGPVLTQSWGMPPEAIGYLSSVSSIGICWYLACGGPMLRHFGPIRSLQLGLLCVAAGLLLLLPPSMWIGLLGALVLGLGIGPNTPAGSQVLMRTAPAQHRSLIFSIRQAGVPLGGAIAGVAVAPLVINLGLDVAICVLSFTMVATSLLVQACQKRLDDERGPPQRSWPLTFLSLSAFVRSVSLIGSYKNLPMLTALGVSFSISQACVTAFTATYLVTQHGKTLAEAGQLVAVLLAASTLARVICGWTVDRLGGGFVLLCVLAVGASSAILMITIVDLANSWAAYACMALLGATSLGWNGVHIAELARIPPLAQVGEVTSAASLLGFVGSLCGPIAFVAVVRVTGSFEWAFATAAAQLAAFAAFAFWRQPTSSTR